jgi:hypothetical protein
MNSVGIDLHRKRSHVALHQIRDRKLAPGLKGKTPVQSVAVQLAVHAKRGLYVARAEPRSRCR